VRAPRQLWKANLRALMTRCELREADVAWMTDTTIRQVHRWRVGQWPIPRAVSLLLQAYEAGLVTAPWLAARIDDDPPR
jgi:hypothetical protein